MDSKVQIFLDGYIQDIKLNDDGSQLAVCCGAAVVLFDKPTSGGSQALLTSLAYLNGRLM